MTARSELIGGPGPMKRPAAQSSHIEALVFLTGSWGFGAFGAMGRQDVNGTPSPCFDGQSFENDVAGFTQWDVMGRQDRQSFLG